MYSLVISPYTHDVIVILLYNTVNHGSLLVKCLTFSQYNINLFIDKLFLNSYVHIRND